MLWLVLVACGRTAPPSEAAAARTVAIDVHEDPVADRWTVTWTLPRPASGISFPRNTHLFRAKTWTAGPGTAFAVDGDREVLRGDRPATVFTASFPTDVHELVKDYRLNLTFTDGSRLLYTGHLDAEPIDSSAQRLAFAWHFSTSPARTVRMLDHASEGALDWTSIDGEDGEYAFFGNIEPLPAPEATFNVDPGLPPWLATLTRDDLPRIFDLDAQRTGVLLGFQPVVAISYDPSGHGWDLKGGGLPRFIQLDARGTWAEDPAARRQWLWFVAHEAFHMWNGEVFDSEEWFSEGSSDDAARRTLRELGEVDDDGYAQSVLRAANTCLEQWAGKPILGQKPPYLAFYACSSLAFPLADASLGPDGGPRAIARAFADANGETIDEAHYLRAIAALGGDPEPVRSLLEEGASAEKLALWLTRAGIGSRVSSMAEAELEPREHELGAIRMLARCAGARGGTRVGDGVWRLEGAEWGPLAGFRLAAIAGHPLATDAAGAHVAVATVSGSIAITAEDGAVAHVTCEPGQAAEPERLAWVPR
jgi:hypothetical protein